MNLTATQVCCHCAYLKTMLCYVSYLRNIDSETTLCSLISVGIAEINQRSVTKSPGSCPGHRFPPRDSCHRRLPLQVLWRMRLVPVVVTAFSETFPKGHLNCHRVPAGICISTNTVFLGSMFGHRWF